MKTIERPTQTGNHPHIGGSGPSLAGADSPSPPHEQTKQEIELTRKQFAMSIALFLYKLFEKNGLSKEKILMNMHLIQKLLVSFVDEFNAVINSSKIRGKNRKSISLTALAKESGYRLGPNITDNNFPVREMYKPNALYQVRTNHASLNGKTYIEIQKYFLNRGYRVGGIEHLFDMYIEKRSNQIPIVALRDFYEDNNYDLYFPCLDIDNEGNPIVRLLSVNDIHNAQILLVQN
jgi:hypothetical protein